MWRAAVSKSEASLSLITVACPMTSRRVTLMSKEMTDGRYPVDNEVVGNR
jgi:hypothetical protein